LIAAKSLLRFQETDIKRTEYVLIGTLLSFGVAVLLGVIINSKGTIENIVNNLLI
jgi:ABC-type nitrate/sulfonate/bicarbonate transport system permease component